MDAGGRATQESKPKSPKVWNVPKAEVGKVSADEYIFFKSGPSRSPK